MIFTRPLECMNRLDLTKISSMNKATLQVDHLTFDGGGGVDFEEKIPARQF